jgi:hypothetical protein
MIKNIFLPPLAKGSLPTATMKFWDSKWTLGPLAVDLFTAGDVFNADAELTILRTWEEDDCRKLGRRCRRIWISFTSPTWAFCRRRAMRRLTTTWLPSVRPSPSSGPCYPRTPSKEHLINSAAVLTLPYKIGDFSIAGTQAHQVSLIPHPLAHRRRRRRRQGSCST